jgi:outer membrane protein OmpA-like peptidoglycan-associated protein
MKRALFQASSALLAVLANCTLIAQGLAQAPSLPPPSPFPVAFQKAVGDVLGNANIPSGAKADLLIDPLVDGNTGAQSSTTRSMEQQIRQLIDAKFADKYQVRPFTAENVARAPLLLIGTFTPIHATANAAGPRDTYRLCFALVDLKAKLILSKGFARAISDGIRAVPTPAFAESPFWQLDPAVRGYIRTCQGPKAGDPINPDYVDKVEVASVISEAIVAFDRGDYAGALALYEQARRLPGGDQLRVHNGLYLTNWKLNRQAEAKNALSNLVDYGLKGERLGVLMLFVVNTTDFVPGMISQSYPLWLSTIADRALANNACLELVGHSSRTGPEAWNDTLSAARAEAVKDRISKLSPTLADKLKSDGKGWHESIIGTGRDDATDAIDRRVEFKVVKC